MTAATSRSACSECSAVKEELVDVKCMIAAQQLEMDTLHQLVEFMRSSSMTAPPSGPSTTDAQTFTPIGSPMSIPHAVSLPMISCPSLPSPDVPSLDGHDQACLPTLPIVSSVDHSPCVPSPTLPDQQDVSALPPVPSMESSPSQPPLMLPINTCIIVTPTVGASGHISESPTPAPTVQDPTSSILVSNGGDEDYSPPSCPPPPMPPMEDSMDIDSPAHPPPTIMVSSPDAPGVAVQDAMGTIDCSEGCEGDTQMD